MFNTKKIKPILIVDDQPENLMVLSSFLEFLDYDFIKAGSGEDALRKLAQNEISIILLDIQMPGMDGFETARFIHKQRHMRGIPIIFMSGATDGQGAIIDGKDFTGIEFLPKPFDIHILKNKLFQLLN